SSIDHFGSYSCRVMRTSSGPSTRMSTHATADAIDIAGFGLSDGTRIRLLADWGPDGPKADFLRAVRDGACEWFSLTLSPDYNRLHADHFHLQSRGWGLCR
ncbi:MAG: extensin family protein, partial [Pseudomonadota bacterium]